MIKNNRIIQIIFIFSIFFTHLSASFIDVTLKNQNILEKSELFIDKNNLSLDAIKKSKDFKANHREHINLGFVKNEVVWIRLTLKNDTKEDISRILEVKNSLLEEVSLYHHAQTIVKGMLHVDTLQTTIQPSFCITIGANTSQTIYLKIKSETTALRFGLFLKDKETFAHQDHLQQTSIMIFLGIIISLCIYNFLLYAYTKEKSYLFYSLYLAALIFQQITYLGISPLFFTPALMYADNLIVVLKVNIMFIMAALFAKSFLQTQKYKGIHRIYNFIIIVGILEIPLFGTQWFYYPEVGILTGLAFVIFNIYAGIYIYAKGYKQARFFVMGWSVLVVGFVLMILDGIGLISVMNKFPNIIMYSTALEALLLSLAFTDSYIILRQEKEKADMRLLGALQSRQKVIDEEILKRTKDLNSALESKKTLLKELHHRTKNNLQFILSLVRIQSDTSKEKGVKSVLEKLNGRIQAISKTHQMLFLKDDLQFIDMDEYIHELCMEMQEFFVNQNVRIEVEAVEIYMPLREAGYLGLIINEIITNSMKYAGVENIYIAIEMAKEDDTYRLRVKDNGRGFKMNHKSGTGTTIIKTLVENQLEGKMKIENKAGLSYTIEFRL